MSEPGDPHEVGSLGEEAAKLFGAMSGWAHEHAGEGLSGFAAHAAAAMHDLDDHLSTGSAECTVCPLCRTIHAVRRLSPDVTDHLSSAAVSLAHVAAAFVATVEHQQPSATEVQHIDLDDD